MNNLGLLPRRIIALYLNAYDKIKTMALVSRQWNEFIYSGYGWEVLFNQQYDSKWNPHKITERIFKMFKHFKGVNDIFIHQNRFSVQHLQAHISELKNIHLIGYNNLKESSSLFQTLIKLLASEQISSRIVNKSWDIPRLHILAAKGTIKQQGQADSIESYLKSGASINAVDWLNLTPLYYAIRFCRDPKVVQYLLMNGADAKLIQMTKNTPLHTSARWSKYVQVFQFIFQQWQDLKAIDSEKRTPLHQAAKNQNPDIIKSLLKKKPDVNIKDKNG